MTPFCSSYTELPLPIVQAIPVLPGTSVRAPVSGSIFTTIDLELFPQGAGEDFVHKATTWRLEELASRALLLTRLYGVEKPTSYKGKG